MAVQITLSAPNKDQEVWSKFDEYVLAHPKLFPSDGKRTGLRSKAVLGVLRFIVDHPAEFAKLYDHELGLDEQMELDLQPEKV